MNEPINPGQVPINPDLVIEAFGHLDELAMERWEWLHH
jgi:hypothetical protein